MVTFVITITDYCIRLENYFQNSKRQKLDYKKAIYFSTPTTKFFLGPIHNQPQYEKIYLI